MKRMKYRWALSENAEWAARVRRSPAAALFTPGARVLWSGRGNAAAPATSAFGDGTSPVRRAAKLPASRSPVTPTIQTPRNRDSRMRVTHSTSQSSSGWSVDQARWKLRGALPPSPAGHSRRNPLTGVGYEGVACESGGIGRRAGFRIQWANTRGGSSPPFRTTSRQDEGWLLLGAPSFSN